MKASIVVLNYNTGDILDRCIRCLLAQDVDDYELLLVDNASTDGSRERVEERFGDDPRLRVIRSPENRGCAGGRNLGFTHSTGEIIAFVDSDAFAEPTWLRAVLDAARGEGVGIIASTQIYLANPHIYNGLGGTMNLQGYGWDLIFGEPVAFTDPPAEAVFASGNGLSVRREVYERIGGFDERYFNYYEDLDFCLRARRAGWQVALATGGALHHVFGLSDTINKNKAVLCERNRIRTVLKHYPLGWIARWLRREIAFERGEDPVTPAGVFPRAWLSNIASLLQIVWWRTLEMRRLGRLDIESLFEPSWGYPRNKGYNLNLRPSTAIDERLKIGEAGEGGLLYGWFEAEAGGEETVRFRWTDGLAAFLLNRSRPSRRLRLRYCWPDSASAAGGATLYVLHRESGQAFAGELTAAPQYHWTEYEAALELPAGELEVVVHTNRCFAEPSFPYRDLGPAVSELELTG